MQFELSTPGIRLVFSPSFLPRLFPLGIGEGEKVFDHGFMRGAFEVGFVVVGIFEWLGKRPPWHFLNVRTIPIEYYLCAYNCGRKRGPNYVGWGVRL